MTTPRSGRGGPVAFPGERPHEGVPENGAVTDPLSFFTRAGDDLLPAPLACSMWSEDQMHGVALSGALAWAAERCLAEAGRTDLRPARWAVDLFRPARMVPCTLSAEIEREGRRICLVDVILSQDGERVARGTATFLKPSAATDGEVWAPTERPEPPPLDVVPASTRGGGGGGGAAGGGGAGGGGAPPPPRARRGGGGGAGGGPPPAPPAAPAGGGGAAARGAGAAGARAAAGWSQDFLEHQNAERKTSWSTAVPVVAGEPLTGFQAAAATADGASMVTNWGTRGIEHINTDITMTLAREPEGVEIGLLATDRVEHEGIAVGTAAVFDRRGPLGTVIVAALANARRTVDLSAVSYSEDGRRRSR